jgi:hypothetical protein
MTLNLNDTTGSISNCKRKKARLTIGVFENWRIHNLPKCVYPQNKDYSTIGLGKKQRDFVLKAHGFKNYAAYLRSDLWLSIRAKILKNATCACGCGQFANQVHHKAYTEANLMGATPRGLIAINHDCHYKIEFAGQRKLSLGEANHELKDRQYDSAANCKPPTEDEIKMFLSGKHKNLTEERKRAVKLHLKKQHDASHSS